MMDTDNQIDTWYSVLCVYVCMCVRACVTEIIYTLKNF